MADLQQRAVQVVDHRGFAPRGRALGVPKSKLSRRIALLEERLGTRLIQRSTRRFTVTEAERSYSATARQCWWKRMQSTRRSRSGRPSPMASCA